jgi:uncharacterized protein (DUF2236 family)
MSEAPRDRGLIGPESVAWKVIGHPAATGIGGLRTLLIEALHPLAMAGVAQHSEYRTRPLDRMRRTYYYVVATVFGDTATAHAAAARVRLVHKRVHGIDPVTGAPYSAEDPDTQVWVHTVQWYSYLVAYRRFAGRLSAADEDRYMAEGVKIAALVGTPEDRVPASVDAARAYFAAIRPRLCVSDAARDAIEYVLHGQFSLKVAHIYFLVRAMASAALATLPRDLRRMAGIERSRESDALAIAAVRPMLVGLTLPFVRSSEWIVVGKEAQEVRERALRSA